MLCRTLPSSEDQPSSDHHRYSHDEQQPGWRNTLRKLISNSSGYSDEIEEEAYAEGSYINRANEIWLVCLLLVHIFN